jgi:hypothetical protein
MEENSMKELDCVEVIVEKEVYAKVGVHKGMQGWICDSRCIEGCWLVNFPRYGEQDDIAEIDILESENRWIARQAAHSYYSMHLKKATNYHIQQRIDTERYNVYAVEILPDLLIFSINNKETFRYKRIEGAGVEQYPFGTEYYLMLDMQVGGDTSWLPVPDPKTFPAYMDIDWVKMYKLKK